MFAYLYRTLYLELLQPDDDFVTRCRKAVITIFFILGIINLATNTLSIINSKDEWTVVKAVNDALFYLVSVIWIASWKRARLTRSSPDWLINLVIEVSLFLMVVMNFSSPEWHQHALCLGCAITAVLLGTSHMKFQVAVSSFVFMINIYDSLDLPSHVLPGSYEGSILIRQIINGVAASLVLWAVYVAMKQFCLLIAKSATSVQMVKEVSKLLAAYNTAGALDPPLCTGKV